MEIWKDIKGYEGLYQVSNYGRVRSLNYNRTFKCVILKQNNVRGYKQVGLHKNGNLKNFFVHRLVATAFIPNPENLQEVNHKDENPQNNNVENLEWCDRRYNINYLNRNKKVSDKNTNGILSKVVLQFTKDGRLVREWPSANECCRSGFSKGHISKCCRGERKTHKGFIWKYKRGCVISPKNDNSRIVTN